MRSAEVISLIESSTNDATRHALGELVGRLRLEEQREEELAVFSAAVGDPKQWITVAQQLLYAAAVLKKPLDELAPAQGARGAPADAPHSLQFLALFRVQMLVLAFAVENAFKAVLVAKGTIHAKNGEIEGLGKKGHDLIALAEAVGVNCEGIASDCLNTLTHASTWLARYPVPMRAADYSTFLSSARASERIPNLLRFAEWVLNKSREELGLEPPAKSPTSEE